MAAAIPFMSLYLAGLQEVGKLIGGSGGMGNKIKIKIKITIKIMRMKKIGSCGQKMA